MMSKKTLGKREPIQKRKVLLQRKIKKLMIELDPLLALCTCLARILLIKKNWELGALERKPNAVDYS